MVPFSGILQSKNEHIEETEEEHNLQQNLLNYSISA